MRHRLVVSSGTGPAEVRRFVALLADHLAARCGAGGLAIVDRQVVGDPAAPRSVTLLLEGDEPAFLGADLGTHALVQRSAERGRHDRKRWFAAVRLERAPAPPGPRPALRPRELEVQACRARGPGGQNVNKRSTAVRLTHRPTGCSVKVETERSQAANRRRAEARLRGLVAAQAAAVERFAAEQLRLGHYRVERGRPVRTYRLDDTGALREV